MSKHSKNFLWPKIESTKEANDHIKSAGHIAVFICVASVGVSIAVRNGYLPQMSGYKDSFWSIFIYGPLAYLIYEQNKYAVYSLTGFYVLDQIFQIVAMGSSPSILAIFITAMLITSCRAVRFIERASLDTAEHDEEHNKEAA